MNEAPSPPGGGARDDIIIALILGAAAAAAVGGVGYMLGRNAARPTTPQLPPRAVVAPTPLKEIAAAAHVQPPTALVHLRRLQDEGKVQRVDTEFGPRYAVLPFLRCEWIEPDREIKETWQSTHPVDWRFPLVTRVPDERAQAFLLEWLDRAQARQLLPPPKSRFEQAAEKHRLLQILVYGSCARGDAGPNSDLDILVYGDVTKKAFEQLKDLAHEISLVKGRAPDVRLMDRQTWDTSTPAFQQAVYRDGKTVYSNDTQAPFLERPLTVQK